MFANAKMNEAPKGWGRRRGPLGAQSDEPPRSELVSLLVTSSSATNEKEKDPSAHPFSNKRKGKKWGGKRKRLTQETRPTENDDALPLPLVLHLQIRVLHQRRTHQGREQHEDRDEVEFLLDLDVGLVDAQTDRGAVQEGEGVREGGHDVGDEGEGVGREVEGETSGEEGGPDCSSGRTADGATYEKVVSGARKEGRRRRTLPICVMVRNVVVAIATSVPGKGTISPELLKTQRGKQLTLVPHDALDANLARDGRKTSSDPANHLTQNELKRRAVEVPGPHHEPRAREVDEHARDADPAVPLRDFGTEAGDDGGDRCGKDV